MEKGSRDACVPLRLFALSPNRNQRSSFKGLICTLSFQLISCNVSLSGLKAARVLHAVSGMQRYQIANYVKTGYLLLGL